MLSRFFFRLRMMAFRRAADFISLIDGASRAAPQRRRQFPAPARREIRFSISREFRDYRSTPAAAGCRDCTSRYRPPATAYRRRSVVTSLTGSTAEGASTSAAESRLFRQRRSMKRGAHARRNAAAARANVAKPPQEPFTRRALAPHASRQRANIWRAISILL